MNYHDIKSPSTKQWMALNPIRCEHTIAHKQQIPMGFGAVFSQSDYGVSIVFWCIFNVECGLSELTKKKLNKSVSLSVRSICAYHSFFSLWFECCLHYHNKKVNRLRCCKYCVWLCLLKSLPECMKMSHLGCIWIVHCVSKYNQPKQIPNILRLISWVLKRIYATSISRW